MHEIHGCGGLWEICSSRHAELYAGDDKLAVHIQMQQIQMLRLTLTQFISNI